MLESVNASISIWLENKTFLTREELWGTVTKLDHAKIGNAEEVARATRPCSSGFTCEAGSHNCHPTTGNANDLCYLTRPYGGRLTCG